MDLTSNPVNHSLKNYNDPQIYTSDLRLLEKKRTLLSPMNSY